MKTLIPYLNMFNNNQLHEQHTMITTLRDLLESERSRPCVSCLNAHAEAEHLRGVIVDMKLQYNELWRVFLSSNNSALSRIGVETIPIKQEETSTQQDGIALLAAIAGAKVG